MSKLTVLRIDDEPEILRADTRVLKDHFIVLTAATIEQAVLLADRADVIVTDWNLGEQTAKVLLELFPNKPTLIVTGNPDAIASDECGLYRVLTKPVSKLKDEILYMWDAYMRDAYQIFQQIAKCPNCDSQMNIGATTWKCTECGFTETR